MKIITNEIKDKIIEHIIEKRQGAFFVIENSDSESFFGIDSSLLYSFLSELSDLGLLRSFSGDRESASGFTSSALDSFYSEGGFVKRQSIKNLLEDKLLYEVNQILRTGEKAEKTEILDRVKGLLPIIDTLTNVVGFVGIKSIIGGGIGSGG